MGQGNQNKSNGGSWYGHVVRNDNHGGCYSSLREFPISVINHAIKMRRKKEGVSKN